MSTMELAPVTPGRTKPTPVPTPTYRDLHLVSRIGDLVTFGAQSRSDRRHTNLVNYDVVTGEIYCECRYCETHPDDEPGVCWLSREVPKAWRATIGREVA